MRYLIAAALCAAFSWPTYAQTQLACAPRDDVLARLQERYGEQPVLRAFDAKGNLIEFTSSENGETWTLLVELPGPTPQSCVLTGGTDWAPIPADTLEWKPKGEPL